MLILFNGRVGLNPLQTAVAVEEDRIAAVGTDAEILALDRPGTQKINLGDKTLWPGLRDSHLHLEKFAISLQQVNCETRSREECLARVREKASTLTAGSWMLGRGWNQNEWGNGFGTAAELDPVSLGHPVFLYDKSLHSAWVNSKALVMAGITRSTPDPKGGIIQRDEAGDPTGILFETAVDLVDEVIPPPSSEERLNFMRAAQEQLIQLGLTNVTDFDPLTSYATLLEMQQDQSLKLRVTKGIPIEKLDWAIEQGIQSGTCNGRIRWGSLKLFADGALGPQTAAMLRPYEDNSSNFGSLQLTADEIFETGIRASSRGISLAIHAIGDRATHEVLNGYAMLREYEKCNHYSFLKHRIEHLQLLHRDNLNKCAELGITASMQPIHILSDMYTADRCWGSRSAYAYAFHTLLNSGARLIFGSDAPVASPNPFWGIHAAVTRRRQDGQPSVDGWNSQERISLTEALSAYSNTPAELENNSSHIDIISSGQLADLIVLAENPYKIDPQQLFTLKPQSVMIGGEWVYQI